MAFDSKLTKFAAKTTTGSQIIDTGLGTTADAMIFFFGTFGTTENDVFDDIRFGTGLATADLEQLANGFSWPWNADQVKGSGVDLHSDAVIKIPGAPDGSGNYNETIIAHAELVDVNSDGTIELDWHVVTGVAFPITVFAMSGINNAEIGAYFVPNGNTTTNVGFRPSTVFFVMDGHNYSTNYWQYGFGFASDLTHIPERNDDHIYPRNSGGDFVCWESFSGVPAADGTYADGVGTGIDNRCINTFAPGAFDFQPDYDSWSVSITNTGWNTTKVVNWVGTGVFVGYLAIDTVVSEIVAYDTWLNNEVSPLEYHNFSRVAANSILVTDVDGGTDFQGGHEFGVIDRHGTKSSIWVGLKDNRGGNQFSPSQASGGSFNDRIYTKWQPRIEGDPSAIELSTVDGELNYFTPTKSQFITYDSPLRGLALGELALPTVETIEPIVFCPSGGDPLYVRFQAIANPNQLQSQIYWEWGTDTSYGNETEVCQMTNNQGWDWSGHYKTVTDFPVILHVGYPLASVPLVSDVVFSPFQVINGGGPNEQEFDWEQGTYHIRAVISNYNGITYGNDVEFTINCGGIVDLSKIRLRAFRDGDA